MRFLFVVRFRESSTNHNRNCGVKSFKTVAKSSKDAARRMHKKGRIISVKKVKRVAP